MTSKPATTSTPAAGATTTTNGKGPKCAPDETLVKGVCKPTETPKTKGKSGAAQSTDNGQAAPSDTKSNNGAAASGNGAAATGNGAAATGNGPGKGKGAVKCGPNEELIKGVCTPKGGAAGTNSDSAPAQ